MCTICNYRFFFFKDTSTTEFYTYGHTLALHDALPICVSLLRRSTRCTTRMIRERRSHPHRRRRSARLDSPGRNTAGSIARSEEHTSELQSLMRISYAVFCLKKKITIHLSSLSIV